MAYEEFSRIYDKLIKEDINYKEITKRILSIASDNSINMDDYLDLACGTGNVSCLLSDKFKNTYLVDMSYDMLSEANNKFLEKGLKASVVCQDMTELNLMQKFDLITCVLDSTNYLLYDDELEGYFKGIYNHLKDNGIFIFDINSYYKISNILGNNIYIHNEDDIFYSWENEFEDDIVSMYLTFFVRNNETGLYEKFEEEHEERGYKESFIEQVLNKCNLKVINKFNGYTNEAVNNKSERILYVVKKI